MDLLLRVTLRLERDLWLDFDPPHSHNTLEKNNNLFLNIFKIFKYPDHAEIWHIDHWNLSASKRMALMERCHKQDDELASRRHKEASAYQKFMRVKDAILVIIPALEYDQRGLSQLCRTLMQAPRELTDKFTGLTAIIHDEKS